MVVRTTSVAAGSVEQVLTDLLEGSIVAADGSTEGAYHDVWVERALSALEPVVMAARGGALADRLAWVFMAGYQATLRRAFPQLPVEPGWMAFANTEGVGDLPGTVLTGEPGQRRLSGWKTWLAGADHVERLLVSARHNELPFLVIRRDTVGVTVEHSRSGGYLAELVQGRVGFDDVAIAEEQVTGDATTFPTFRASEGAYVRVALNAFMLSHARRLDGPASLIGGAVAGLLAAMGAVALELPSAAASLAVAGVDQQTRALTREFEVFVGTADPALHERWLRDQRLFLGGASLAERAEVALSTLRLALPRPSSA